jgi:tRNA A-37 threonylcarbamoyl transferase component Bud32
MTSASCCKVCGCDLHPDSTGEFCPDCEGTVHGDAATPTATVELEPALVELGEALPQLEILELLGRGGMGSVYKARQKNLDRMVALKVLPVERQSDLATEQRFMREARALARLSHPNIVVVHDFGQASDFWYFVMEYVDGVNMRQAMRSQQVAPDQAVRIVPLLCDALQYAHDQGIVHRDIKPENVLLDRDSRVKIADFGLAQLRDETVETQRLTSSSQAMGTVGYMAPEQFENPLSVDHRADIYALGVLFYEMVTGELPMGRFQPPSYKGAVSRGLDEVVLRALEKDPDRRYQRASDVKSDVERISSGANTIARAAAPAPAPMVDMPSAHGAAAAEAPTVLLERRADANVKVLDEASQRIRRGAWIVLGMSWVLLFVGIYTGVLDTLFAPFVALLTGGAAALWINNWTTWRYRQPGSTAFLKTMTMLDGAIWLYLRSGGLILFIGVFLIPLGGMDAAQIVMLIGAIMVVQGFFFDRIRNSLRSACVAGTPVAE